MFRLGLEDFGRDFSSGNNYQPSIMKGLIISIRVLFVNVVELRLSEYHATRLI